MKTRILLLSGLFVLLGAGVLYAGTICIDETSSCNDVKIVYSDQEGEILNVFGYEYGCGYSDRILSGSAKMVGRTVYIGLTGSFNSAQAPNPTLSLKNYTLNLDTKAGTGSWSYINSAYWNGTTSLKIVPCPSSEEAGNVNNEPDASQP